MRISFRIKLLASHAAVALAVSSVTLVVVERVVSRHMEAQVDDRLESQAQAVARWLDNAGHPNRLAGRLAGVVGAEVTIVDERGIAMGESWKGAYAAAQEADGGVPREVRVARTGRVGRETRLPPRSDEQVRYVAVPAPAGWVVRLGLPIGQIDETKADLRRQLGVGAIASLIAALALAAFVAAALTRRLRAARELAQRIAAGDYDVEVTDDSSDAVGVLSKTLVTAARELEATEAQRREFLANVAHEIRTPVTSIGGYAETLASTEVDADTRREFVQTIHRNAVRIARLVEDLLELEALQAGKARPPALEPVELAPVVDDVIATLQVRTPDLASRLSVDVAEDLAPTGDPDGIERILLNLVDNAFRHGGPEVAVAIAARRRGDRVTITVSDDGPGISPEQQARVFERFHRGAQAGDRSGGGSGLGLAIARELAQVMGGSLTLASAAGKGARFTVELPA